MLVCLMCSRWANGCFFNVLQKGFTRTDTWIRIKLHLTHSRNKDVVLCGFHRCRAQFRCENVILFTYNLNRFLWLSKMLSGRAVIALEETSLWKVQPKREHHRRVVYDKLSSSRFLSVCLEFLNYALHYIPNKLKSPPFKGT